MKAIVLALVLVAVAGSVYGWGDERNNIYFCDRCGHWWRDTGWRCLVEHAPGECCHQSQIDLGNGRFPVEQQKPDTDTMSPIGRRASELTRVQMADTWPDLAWVDVGDSLTNHVEIDPAILDQLNRIEGKLDRLLNKEAER